MAGHCAAGKEKPDGGGGLAGSGGAGRCGDGEQTVPAQAVGVVGGDEGFVFDGQPDTIALALGDIAHPTFEGGLTTGAIFGFSPGGGELGGGELGHGKLGHGECGFEPRSKVRHENVSEVKIENACWRATGSVIHSVLPAQK